MPAPHLAGRSFRAWFLASPFLLAACGGGGSGSGGGVAPPGTELAKPGGGTFFLDPHGGGGASRLHLAEVQWGRLVDVHQLDSSGAVDPTPVFRDLLINEATQSNGLDYALETNPITQRTSLTVLRQRGVPDTGTGTFESLLEQARAGLPPVLPQDAQGTAGGPVSLVARNAGLSLRFDDLLDDSPASRVALVEYVRVLTGTPPVLPFVTRIVFDPNHGGLASGAFHSTRVLVDLTVSEEEAQEAEFPLQVNSLGLPASFPGDGRPSASLRLPTRPDPGSGQFAVLRNLAGAALDRRDNGPVDLDSPSLDLVRGLRAGRQDDANSGFLLDFNQPEIVAAWSLSVLAAHQDPLGRPGFDLLLDVRFTTPCRRSMHPGDILQVAASFLEVRLDSGEPDGSGAVGDVRVRVLADEPIAQPGSLLGLGQYVSTFAPGLTLPGACWVSVVPPPADPPERGLSADSLIQVRFSEPMSPGSVDPFDTLRLGRGDVGTPPLPTNLVVADAVPSADLRTFTLRPLLPLAQGSSGEYHIDLATGSGGLTDLAGNALPSAPLAVRLVLDPDEDPVENSGVVLRFGSTDELEPLGKPDLRGQCFYDLERGRIRGRAATFESFSADRSQPVPGIMVPFAPGVQTPLSGLGSKLQTVWRHCDLGWSVEDETKHNLDVIGLSWTPVGGVLLNDFFERFEMRLAHSRRLPDEFRTFVGTTYPCSGLGAGANICTPCLTNVPYEDNILRDPRSPPVIVHERSFGYRLRVSDLFIGHSGTLRLPYPMNRGGGPFTSFTWRDTAVLAKDGLDSAGIPLLVEVSPPLGVISGPAGRIAPPGKVPAWGLPLLIEVRCFPSTSALGLNPLEIYLAQNAQQLPVFRGYTTGGVNQNGVAVQVNPDLALFPEGGFNPGSRPPGKPTTFQADNSFYTGDLDTVVRVSRAHTIWIQALVSDPAYLPPVVSPRPSEQPGNARVQLEFRGATGFSGAGQTQAFDARQLDPLGDVATFEGVQFLGNDPTWTSDLTRLDGAGYVQIRFTFVNDIQAQVVAELSAVGLAYSQR